jgi:hypothetical protein
LPKTRLFGHYGITSGLPVIRPQPQFIVLVADSDALKRDRQGLHGCRLGVV